MRRDYSELLDGSAKDARKYWGITNRLRKSEDRDNTKEIKVQDEIVTVSKDAEKVADQFNKFYSDVVPQYRNFFSKMIL